jgi:Tfp pilus assembly PilM family ATPase
VIDRNFNLNDVFQEIVRPAFLPLIEAVDRALIFSASETRGESVKEIFLLGSLARWAGIETLMQTMLHLPVRKIPDPLLLMQDSRSSHARAGQGEPEIAVATGLALKSMLPNV